MANLIIEVDDALLAAALSESQEQQIALDTFINDAIRRALDVPNTIQRLKVDVRELLGIAVEKAREVARGKQFLLTDFFDAEQWEALGNGDRKNLGKDFRKLVEGGDPKIAVHVGRTSGNKAIYRRL